MSANPNWPRWIKASIAKWFNDQLNIPLPMFVEGADRRTNTLTDFCELRINGPFIKQMSPIDYRINVQINILVQSLGSNDAYKVDRDTGLVAAAFVPNISIFKFGDGIGDDSTFLIGCLILKTDGHEEVTINNFGQIESDILIFQSVIEGHYRGDFVN